MICLLIAWQLWSCQKIKNPEICLDHSNIASIEEDDGPSGENMNLFLELVTWTVTHLHDLDTFQWHGYTSAVRKGEGEDGNGTVEQEKENLKKLSACYIQNQTTVDAEN